MAKLIGNKPNQVPTNGDLGTMAYQDYDVVAPQFLAGGNRNLIINGDFKINQRGNATGATNTAYRGPDRFRTSIYSAGTWSVSQSSDVPSGQGFSNSFKMDCTTADTSLSSTHHVMVQYGIEGQDIQHLCYGSSSAKKVTLSFWVKSNKTGTYSVEFEETGNTRHICATYTISSANTWEKKTITIEGDTASTLADDNTLEFRVIWGLAIGPDFTSGTHNTSGWASQTTANRFPSGNVNLADSTNNDWYITGVQLEVGETATPFEYRSVHDEQLRCFRYYYDARFGSNEGGAYSPTTDEQYGYTRSCIAQFPVKMRATPTVSIQSSSANSMDRYGRGQELCYPKAENIYPDHWQNILKYTSAAQTTLSNWQDAGRYINRAGYKADAEL